VPLPLIAVLLLAAAVRVWFWGEARELQFFQQNTGDSATYVALAQQIHDEGWRAPLGEPFRQAPLYPFFLAALNALGWGTAGARTVQFALGTLNAALFWTLGRRLAGRAGAVVASLGALTGPIVFFEAELLSISLALSCLLLGLVARGTRAGGLPAGLLFGLAALAQPNLLAVGLVVGVFALRSAPGRLQALAFLLGLALLPAATLARNVAESGQPVLISSNGGLNFFIGNHAEASGMFSFPPDLGLRNRSDGFFDSARDLAEADAGRPLSDLEVDGFWWRRGLGFWLDQPVAALALTARKALLVLNDYEIPNHYDYETFRSRVPALAVLPTLGWVLPLGALGLLLAVRRGDGGLAVYAVAVVVSVVPFFVTARYRLPLYLALWPAAGLAVAQLPSLWRDPRARAASALIVAAGALVCWWPLNDREASRAHMANAEGVFLFAEGRLDEARFAFLEAVRADPVHAEALGNLGRVAALAGDVAGARDYYTRSIAANPLEAGSYLQLEALERGVGDSVAALATLDRLERAREGRVRDVAAQIAYRRAYHLHALGQTERAIVLLEASLERAPGRRASWETLAQLYREQGRAEDAVRAARRAAALPP